MFVSSHKSQPKKKKEEKMPGDQHNPLTLYLHDNHKVHHAMYSGKREFNFLCI